MPAFPAARYDDSGAYLDAYVAASVEGWRSVDRDEFRRVSHLLAQAYRENRRVFVCGNGGSAAIAIHFECDHLKGVSTGTDLAPRVHALGANVAVLTAVANDIGYDRVFAFQLERLAEPNDVVVAVSSSGNSPNIVEALEYGNAHGLTTIAMTGFEGGRARELAQATIHVPVRNYGVVEDIHQGLMHVLAQFMRQGRMKSDAIASTLF